MQKVVEVNVSEQTFGIQFVPTCQAVWRSTESLFHPNLACTCLFVCCEIRKAVVCPDPGFSFCNGGPLLHTASSRLEVSKEAFRSLHREFPPMVAFIVIGLARFTATFSCALSKEFGACAFELRRLWHGRQPGGRIILPPARRQSPQLCHFASESRRANFHLKCGETYGRQEPTIDRFQFSLSPIFTPGRIIVAELKFTKFSLPAKHPSLPFPIFRPAPRRVCLVQLGPAPQKVACGVVPWFVLST